MVYGTQVEVCIPDELVKLLVLADRWQMPTVVTPLLVQLEATLSTCDAVRLLSSERYPDIVTRAALAALASKPEVIDGLFKASPSFAAELLSASPSTDPPIL